MRYSGSWISSSFAYDFKRFIDVYYNVLFNTQNMEQRIILLSMFLFILGCNHGGYKNYNDLLKVKTGMSYNEVDFIMTNSPIKVAPAFWNDSLFVQYYEPGFGASDDYKVIFSIKDSIVVDVEYGD